MSWTKEERQKVVGELLELAQTPEQIRFLSHYNIEANAELLDIFQARNNLLHEEVKTLNETIKLIINEMLDRATDH